MRVVLHPEADAEVQTAAFWYDEQRPGLGGEFMAEVTAVLQKVEAAPHSFPRWPGVSGTAEPVRRAVMHRFPYLVAFEGHASSWQSRMANGGHSIGWSARHRGAANQALQAAAKTRPRPSR